MSGFTMWPSVEAMQQDSDEYKTRVGSVPTMDQLVQFRTMVNQRIDLAASELPVPKATRQVAALSARVAQGMVELGDCELDLAMSITTLLGLMEIETVQQVVRELVADLADRMLDSTVPEITHAITCDVMGEH